MPEPRNFLCREVPHRCRACRLDWWPPMAFAIDQTLDSDGRSGSWSYAITDGSGCPKCGVIRRPELPSNPLKARRYKDRFDARAKKRSAVRMMR